MLAVVKKEVGELLKENPDAQIVSLTQGDTLRSFCQRQKCRALDRENGSHAGTMIAAVLTGIYQPNDKTYRHKRPAHDNIS